jgi:hypothetical protein
MAMFAARPQLCAGMCEKKQTNQVYTKMTDVTIPGFRKYWTQKLASLNCQCHAITNKCPEAGSVVQEVHKLLHDTVILAGCTPAKVEEISEWTFIVNSAEENRTKFGKVGGGRRFLLRFTACAR